jgi:hypothetical protein
VLGNIQEISKAESGKAVMEIGMACLGRPEESCLCEHIQAIARFSLICGMMSLSMLKYGLR